MATLIIILFFSSCERKQEPWKLGFSGTLTGAYSDLGIAGRNGVIMRVEEQNQMGGINGRPIELLVKDDKNDPKEAPKVDEELIKAGVVAIIGHMTSEITMASIPLINSKQILMVSPTTSTALLSGKDDYFMRVVISNTEPPKLLADYCTKTGIKKVSAIYAGENKAYCLPVLEAFRATLEEQGGQLTEVRAFLANERTEFDVITLSVLSRRPQAIFIIGSAMDTALLCQQIRKMDLQIPILSSGWGFSYDLITHGGRAVEGVIGSDFIVSHIKSEGVRRFERAYKEYFGIDPNFAALCGYEAAEVVIRGLLEAKDAKGLKDAILKIKRFKGPAGEFEIDRFGDAQRPIGIIKVEKGTFVVENQ
jgi:branched-chain amino acid transport system substrate-binding protein